MDEHVRLLFHQLIELSPSEREQILREQQIGPEIRAEVESLLNFDSTNVQSFIDSISDAAGEVLRAADGR